MVFIVNGKEHDLDIKTLNELFAHYKLDPLTVVVEKNGLIVHRDQYAYTAVEKNDRFEIVRFVGGG